MKKTLFTIFIANLIIAIPILATKPYNGAISYSYDKSLQVANDFGINIVDIINPNRKKETVKDASKESTPEIKEKVSVKAPQKPVITKKEIIVAPEGVEKEIAEQGDSIFITVKSPKELKAPYITFKGKKINLYKKEEGIYKAHIGIDAWHKKGNYTIAFKDSTGNLNDTKNIQVVVKRYPNQYITLTGKKSTLTATADELRKIQLAKTSLDPTAYFNKLPLTNPTKGCIASVYGLNRYYNNVPGSYHKGVDIAAPAGQAIVSPTGGKVTVAEMFRLHGGTVGIDHGQGITSIYLHMSKITVKPGQIIKAGEKIGEVGSTGISTGSHLHWGLYINGIPIDPYIKWVKPIPGC